MKNIGININSEKDPNDKILNLVLDIIKSEYKVFIYKDSLKLHENNDNLDFVISIGGDGTTLKTARAVAKSGTPILAINFGNLGFLTTAEGENLNLALKKVLNNEFYIEERIMLECKVKNNENSHTFLALNDIVLSKKTLSRIINYELTIDNKYYDKICADGIIVSTPTGSTAYSLSSGGSIIYPTLNVINITPICPISSNYKSMILDGNSIININLKDNKEKSFLIEDGQENLEIDSNTLITIKKSKYKCKLIKMHDYNYFNILKKKIIQRNIK